MALRIAAFRLGFLIILLTLWTSGLWINLVICLLDNRSPGLAIHIIRRQWGCIDFTKYLHLWLIISTKYLHLWQSVITLIIHNWDEKESNLRRIKHWIIQLLELNIHCYGGWIKTCQTSYAFIRVLLWAIRVLFTVTVNGFNYFMCWDYLFIYQFWADSSAVYLFILPAQLTRLCLFICFMSSIH